MYVNTNASLRIYTMKNTVTYVEAIKKSLAAAVVVVASHKILREFPKNMKMSTTTSAEKKKLFR